MSSSDSHEDVASGKYNIEMNNAQGPVIGDHNRVDQHFYASPGSALTNEQKSSRKAMLANVKSRWISDFLASSLHGATLLAIRLYEEQADALNNPWHDSVQETDWPAQPLPAGISIIKVYDQAQGKLLLLGEPGAGKTTLLLTLARALLERAEHDEEECMPVVFNLSSWAMKRQPFAVWLVEELHTKYQVSRKLAQNWVDTHQITLLLDGLDEIAAEHRAAGIEAINAYLSEHGLSQSLVICSRRAIYFSQRKRVQLRKAVTLQSVTAEQIDMYLSSVGEQLVAVRVALRSDQELQELVKTPLMFNIVALAYQGRETDDLLARLPPNARQHHVFEMYVQYMLKRRGVSHYTPDQVERWLGWLAHQMTLHSQSEFYIERMQFNWLPENQSRHLTIAVILLFKLIVASGAGLAGLFAFGLPWGLLWGLLSGLIGAYLAKSDLVQGEIEPAEQIHFSWRDVKPTLANALISGLKTGLLFILFTVLLSILSILLILVRPTGTLFGSDIPLFSLLMAGLMITIGSGLLLILQSGWSSDQLKERHDLRPNQGIWYSARHSIVAGLLFGLIGGLTFSFLLVSPVEGLICGWTIGLSVGLLNGGMACIKHVLLRWCLWHAGFIPWNYAHFLDYAAERILLLKAGGGYLFVHPLLLQYFELLNAPPRSHQDKK